MDKKTVDIDNLDDLKKAKKYLKMKKKLKLNLKKNLFLKLILVTGTHTSGKSMIAPVVASLNKVEILRKFTL